MRKFTLSGSWWWLAEQVYQQQRDLRCEKIPLCWSSDTLCADIWDFHSQIGLAPGRNEAKIELMKSGNNDFWKPTPRQRGCASCTHRAAREMASQRAPAYYITTRADSPSEAKFAPFIGAIRVRMVCLRRLRVAVAICCTCEPGDAKIQAVFFSRANMCCGKRPFLSSRPFAARWIPCNTHSQQPRAACCWSFVVVVGSFMSSVCMPTTGDFLSLLQCTHCWQHELGNALLVRCWDGLCTRRLKANFLNWLRMFADANYASM